MASRKPLVIVGGEKQELPSNDDLSITKSVQIIVFPKSDSVTSGTFKSEPIYIPLELDGANLIGVFAAVDVSGTGSVTSIQVRNVTKSANMLSTELTIDSGEKTSGTAATPAVIDTLNDHVSSNDELAINITLVPATAPKGLIVILRFRVP